MKKSPIIAAALIVFTFFVSFSSFLERKQPLPQDPESEFQKTEQWLKKKSEELTNNEKTNIRIGFMNNLTGRKLEMPLFYLKKYDQALQEKGEHVAVISYPQWATNQSNTPALLTFEYFFDFLQANQRSVMVINGDNELLATEESNISWSKWKELQMQSLEEILKRSEPDYIVLYRDNGIMGSDDELLELIRELAVYVQDHKPGSHTLVQFSHARLRSRNFLEALAKENIEGIGVTFFSPEEEADIVKIGKTWRELTKQSIWILGTWNGRDSYKKMHKQQQDQRWLEIVVALAQKNDFTGVVVQKPEYFFTFKENLLTPDSVDRFMEGL